MAQAGFGRILIVDLVGIEDIKCVIAKKLKSSSEPVIV
ncbi:hypothetical protein P3TCK_12741 [Photobacterium profundum 3TCK]|uniref:Uncharacterized protein n=1 Tax=Photobacterium profundum 3TCK TaxID=314280 RepID=Q1Z5Y9_9GAMM|nr:hypothetical protein P3TCK_12741 [Photobacterium profundum 3TCK]